MARQVVTKNGFIWMKGGVLLLKSLQTIARWGEMGHNYHREGCFNRQQAISNGPMPQVCQLSIAYCLLSITPPQAPNQSPSA